MDPIVKDSEYYKGLLKKRLAEIETAMSNLRSDITRNEYDMRKYSTINKQKDTLDSEISDLRTELYDLNAAIEVMRNRGKDITSSLKSEVSEIEMECERLVAIKRELSDMERSNIELINEKTKQLNAYKNVLREKERKDYDNTVTEIRDLKLQCHVSRDRIANMREEIKTIENEIRSNPRIGRFCELEGRKKSIEHQRNLLQERMSVYSLPVTQQKEHILKFVKDINLKNQEIETLVTSLKTEAKKSDDMALAIRADQRDRSDKFSLISKKKIEIEDFIRRSTEERKSIDESIACLQKQILDKCQGSAKFRKMEKERPDVEHLTSDIHDSQFTTEQLHKQLAHRSAELKRLDDVEAAYIQQVAALSEQYASIETQKEKISDIDKLKAEETAIVTTLEEKLRLLKQELEGSIQTRDLVSLDLARKINDLKNDPLYEKLMVLDQKLRDLVHEIDILNSRVSEALLVDQRKSLAAHIHNLNAKLAKTLTLYSNSKCVPTVKKLHALSQKN